MGIPVKFRPLAIVMIIMVACSVIISQAKNGQAQAEQPFKNLMHQIFHGYNHAQISLGMKKFAVTDIHLRRITAAMEEVPEFMPKYNTDGTPFDRDRFTSNLDGFLNKVKEFRTALKSRNIETVQRFPGDVFSMCIKCHQAAKLEYLFKTPPGARSLFKEYMHKVRENFHDLEILEDSNGVLHDKVDSLILIDYYLELLQPTLPTRGPSGVVANRSGAMGHIQGLRAQSHAMRQGLISGQPINIERFRNSLNGFCVTCHEPERIR